MRPLAARTARISTSQTVAIDAKYKRLKAEGKDVLSLGAGEPDLDTPEVGKLAAIQSIQNGLTKYSAVTGLPELKAAIREKFKRDNHLDYAVENIIVSSGAKHAVFNALLALVEEGDEVLIPSPCWTTYPELVRLLGGTPIAIPTLYANGFKVTSDELNKAVTAKSKLMILNSPGNPTGAVYSKSELEKLQAVIVSHDLYCLSDEIYEYICYENADHVSIASFGPDIFDRTITINGMSKAYAMTGWRVGYTGAPEHLAKAIAAIQSHGTHHPANVSQYAAIACLAQGFNSTTIMRNHLNDCRIYTLKRLSEIPGLEILEPQGAFYVFLGVEAYLGKSFRGKPIKTSFELCEYFLDEYLLATVPGTAFGVEGFIRISFANSIVNLGLAFDRLARGLASLTN